MTVKFNPQVSFGSRSQNNEGFKVNKPLEYMGATVSSFIGLSGMGAMLGAYAGILKNDAFEKVLDEGVKQASHAGKYAKVGALIGAGIALVTLPFTLNRTRERVYSKQLHYDVMNNLESRAAKGELSPEEVAEYMKSTALQSMSVNQGGTSTGSTLGLMAGSYVLGSSRASKK